MTGIFTTETEPDDIFRAANELLFANIHQSGVFRAPARYRTRGARAGEGFSINRPVPTGSGRVEFGRGALAGVMLAFRADQGPLESPTRYAYDTEGGCASAVASRPERLPFHA